MTNLAATREDQFAPDKFRAPHPTLHDAHAVEQFRRCRGIDPDRIRRMRYALYHLHEPLGPAISRLGQRYAEELASTFLMTPLRIRERHDSDQDESSKIVLETWDGLRIEAVILRGSGPRVSVCVSTQAGCQAGCPFCATARMGLQRNLSSDEIIEQVLIAGRLVRDEKRRLHRVVFMGMGEPLDNEEALHSAIGTLLHPERCRLPARQVLVSTVGSPEAMMRLVDCFPGVHIALSLHSARPALRAKLVPRSRAYSWQALQHALRYVAERHSTHRHQGPVMIEHIMLEGVNDGSEDAAALIDYLDGVHAHVNLIPYNPISNGRGWQATKRSRRDEFANQLRQAGIFTTIRYSMGADVRAACGQLAQMAGGPLISDKQSSRHVPEGI